MKNIDAPGVDGDARPQEAQSDGVVTPVRACRRCSDCEGEEHHWMYVGDEDEAGEPVMSCKHCEAVRPVEATDA